MASALELDDSLSMDHPRRHLWLGDRRAGHDGKARVGRDRKDVHVRLGKTADPMFWTARLKTDVEDKAKAA